MRPTGPHSASETISKEGWKIKGLAGHGAAGRTDDNRGFPSDPRRSGADVIRSTSFSSDCTASSSRAGAWPSSRRLASRREQLEQIHASSDRFRYQFPLATFASRGRVEQSFERAGDHPDTAQLDRLRDVGDR
jgi:hypothetical protein